MIKEDNTFIAGVAINRETSAYILGYDKFLKNNSFVLLICKINRQNEIQWLGDRNQENKFIFQPYKSIEYCTIPSPQIIAITGIGQVRIIGLDGSSHDEHISTQSILTRVKSIAGKVYAIGGNREIWRRDNDHEWILIKPIPPNGDNEISFSLDGLSDNDLYVGSSGGELWHFDGNEWTQMEVHTKHIITSVCCAGNGKVYACGREATIIEYEHGKGKPIERIDENHPGMNLNKALGDIFSSSWFGGKLYLSGFNGIFTLEGTHLEYVDFGEDFPESTFNLSSCKETLISVGAKDVFSFDGKVWKRIE